MIHTHNVEDEKTCIYTVDNMLSGCLSFRPRSRTFTMETSPLPVKECTVKAYGRHPRPVFRKVSLSSPIYCDTAPRFFRFH